MKRILFLSILLLMTISLSACTSKGIHSTINNPTGERLYPYKVTTDSGKTFKYGYINNKGKIIIKPQYDYADFYNNGYYRIESDNKWGMMDSKGKVVIKENYQGIGCLYDGLIVAKLNGKFGYINIKGNTVIPFQYDRAAGFSEGKSYVIYKGNTQFIDKSGKVLAHNFKYMYLSNFQDGRAAIILNNGFGYIDENFNIAIAPKYQIAKNFVNGVALVGYSLDKCYLINKKGETIFKFPDGYKLDAVHASDDGKGLIPVIKDGKMGYMDMKGDLTIGCAFIGAGRFVNGYAIASKDNKVCVIDSKGNIITDSLPKDRINMGIIDNLVIYENEKGTSYYTLTGKKIFSSIGK